MAGKTEEVLTERMEQVNGIIDDAFSDMMRYKKLAGDDTLDDSERQPYNALFMAAQKTYMSMMTLLMQMTKNFDEALKVDTHRRKSETAKQPQTTLQKLKAKEERRK